MISFYQTKKNRNALFPSLFTASLCCRESFHFDSPKALNFWSKNMKDIKGTQKVFDNRARMCTLAAQAKWSQDLENK